MKSVNSPLCRAVLLLSTLAVSYDASALQPFVIQDIRIEGLQRISAGTVFNYLPLRQGDRLDQQGSANAIRSLYRTGFFEDVVLEKEGNTLVIFVEERPAIASIEVEGNDAIPTDKLMSSLKELGLAEGRVFDPSLLDKVEQELEREYLNLGRYNARVEATVRPQERNRVAVSIDIAEGEVASIHRINIVGNEVFSDDALLEEFQLGTPPWYAFFSDADQYSKQRLSADLETLRSYYMDRGYLNFSIESTQVTITPDKKDVYVTINVKEGEKYAIGSVKLAGELAVPQGELEALLSVKAGDVFSRRQVTESANRISDRLGDAGYAFANVNPTPEVDEKARKVDLTYLIDPGNRAYVRRINISGNLATQDEVIRRELRQMESSWISTEKVRRSKTRLDRLGFFDEVTVETPPVPGSPDQVDVNYKVDERDAFGSLNVGMGYGESQGFMVYGSVTQENFLGTGQRLGVEVNTSQVNTIYSFSFTEPYYTPEGVSRTVKAYYKETDPSKVNLPRYTTDTYGATLAFDVPLSEYSSFDWGVDYQKTHLDFTDRTPTDIKNFCADNASLDDCVFDTFRLSGGWTYDTRNRAIFPDRGGLTGISGELSLPLGGDSLTFYKTRLRHQRYFPWTDRLTLLAKGEFGYGEAFGDTTDLPPFERYFAGGMRTVRGYRSNTLGPHDEFDNALGGNSRLVGNLELLFPSPFSEDSKSVRLSAFVDGGNVFDLKDGIDTADLRYSAGVAMIWMTPVGPLAFSIAQPLNLQDGDESEEFQFSLGTLY